MVRSNPATDAGGDGVVIWRVTLDRNTGSSSANFGPADANPVRCVFHRRFVRGTGLVGVRHRPVAASFARSKGQHHFRINLGHLPLRGVGAGSPFGGMDRLVVTRHSGIARDHCLDLQQHRQEYLRRGALPHDDQRHLATVSSQWLYPRVSGLITALVAVIVILVWGSRTLTRDDRTLSNKLQYIPIMVYTTRKLVYNMIQKEVILRAFGS